MSSEPVKNINTDPVLSRLVQPYNSEMTEQIKTRLTEQSGRTVITIWNGKHLNCETEYQICTELGIPFELQSCNHLDFNQAAVYICKKQLKRTDLTNEYRKYLIGKEYHYSSLISQQNSSNSQFIKGKVAEGIGNRLYISSATVLKYDIYADAVDTVFESDSLFAEKILMGQVLVSHENIIELSRLRPDEIKSVSKNVIDFKIDHLTFTDIRDGVKSRYCQDKAPVSRKEKLELKLSGSAQIRQMPIYDPDSDINSLCMTIGSWISSIQRVNNSVDFERVTTKARIQLIKELSFLSRTIESIQEALIERTST